MRHEANPLVVDGYEARDPMVLRVGDQWVMYYTATSTPDGGQFVVKAVTSDDLSWCGARVVYTDARAGTYGGTTESPFVVERDGRFFLFIGPEWGMNVERPYANDAPRARERRPVLVRRRARGRAHRRRTRPR